MLQDLVSYLFSVSIESIIVVDELNKPDLFSFVITTALITIGEIEKSYLNRTFWQLTVSGQSYLVSGSIPSWDKTLDDFFLSILALVTDILWGARKLAWTPQLL